MKDAQMVEQRRGSRIFWCLRVLCPWLEHSAGGTLSDDVPGIPLVVEGKPIDVIRVPVGRNHGLQLAAASRLDICGDLLKHARSRGSTVGSLGAAEVVE